MWATCSAGSTCRGSTVAHGTVAVPPGRSTAPPVTMSGELRAPGVEEPVWSAGSREHADGWTQATVS